MTGDVRIGVYICWCGSNIGGVIDVPAVVEYAKLLPGVVYTEDNMYSCSEDGLISIKNSIREHELNRVVIASCTPRTHAPLFQNATEEAGVNRYLFDFVNIRDQCSWIHMKEKDKATEKAKRLVAMGVAKVALLEPLEEFESPVEPTGLVIGGGPAGMSAALNMANQGFDVHLVEIEDELGGLLRNLNIISPVDVPAKDILVALVGEVTGHPNIAIHLGSRVTGVEGYIGNFNVSIEKGGETRQVKAGTIVLATGAKPLKPDMYRYGELPNVVTLAELEKILARGGDVPGRVVFMQCTGSRIPGRTYCSKICCLGAIKNARVVKKARPEAEVYVLHRGIMATGKEPELYYEDAQEMGIKFARYSVNRKPEILGDGEATGVRFYHDLMRREVELPVDMVVLSTPLVPNEDNKDFSKMLKVPLGQEGFFLEAHVKLRPIEFATAGVFIAGNARWPSFVHEAIIQGNAAAAKAAIPMKAGKVRSEATIAVVDRETCIGCGNCVVACPYNAISLQPGPGAAQVAEVSQAECMGCGTCGPACANGSIQQKGFTDRQILKMIDALAWAKEEVGN